MLVVGLTGGIGSGKSAVGAIFASLGVPVLDADLIARELVLPGTAGLSAVAAEFGDAILDPGGGLDRASMRRRIFRDPQARERLQSILHPRIRAEMLRRLSGLAGDYAVLVVPLLLETGQTDLVDRVLVVDVPETLQIERASQRDGVSAEQVHAILRSQCTRAQRLSAADDVIDNSADLERLAATVKTLHASYLSKAQCAAS